MPRPRIGRDAVRALRPETLNGLLGSLRDSLNARLSLPFPGLVFQVDTRLAADRYIVDVDDVPFFSGTLVAQHVLVSGRAADVRMEGVSRDIGRERRNPSGWQRIRPHRSMLLSSLWTRRMTRSASICWK